MTSAYSHTCILKRTWICSLTFTDVSSAICWASLHISISPWTDCGGGHRQFGVSLFSPQGQSARAISSCSACCLHGCHARTVVSSSTPVPQITCLVWIKLLWLKLVINPPLTRVLRVCHIKVTLQSHCPATEILLFWWINGCMESPVHKFKSVAAWIYMKIQRIWASLSLFVSFSLVPLCLPSSRKDSKKGLQLLQGLSNRYTNQPQLKAALSGPS